MVDWILQFYNLWGNKRFKISNSECCYIIYRVTKVEKFVKFYEFQNVYNVERFSIYIWKCNNTARLKNIFFSFYKNKKSILRNRKQKHGLVPTDVTVGALPGGGTGAVEGAVRVHTGGAILTRNVQTLVYVYKYLQIILKKRAIPELVA